MVATVTTDESGCFEILHLGGIAGYRLQIPDIPNGYHIGGWSDKNLANRVKKGKTTNVDYYLPEELSLHTKIINVNCEGATDSASIRMDYLESFYDKNSVTVPYLGCTNVEYNSTSSLPGTRLYSWKVYRPSGVTEGSQIVEVGEGDNEFILEY